MVVRCETVRANEAVEMLHLYLADERPPLLVVHEIAPLLMEEQPQVLVQQICRWSLAQSEATRAGVTQGDLFRHALLKLNHLGQLELLPREPLGRKLQEIGSSLLSLCAAEERSELEGFLHDLPEMTVSPEAGGGLLRPSRAGVRDSAHDRPRTRDLERAEDNLRWLLVRLGKHRQTGTPASTRESSAVPLAVAAVAKAATSHAELEQVFERLRQVGHPDPTGGHVIRTLSRGVPDWLIPGDRTDGFQRGEALLAMQRVVDLDKDPTKRWHRLKEMIDSAVEHFNQGCLGRCVSILELVEQIVQQTQQNRQTTDLMRREAWAKLDSTLLVRFAADRLQVASMRRIVAFFPDLDVESLIERMEGEEDRHQRRLLLSLIEAHGPAAREALVAWLDRQVDIGAPLWFASRNLLHLLRKIPDPSGIADDRVIGHAIRLSSLDHPFPLVREALSLLGSLNHPRAEEALISTCQQIERGLTEAESFPKNGTGLHRLLNVIASRLAQMGTTRARHALIAHGLKQHRFLGDTSSRLTELGSTDLSCDVAAVSRLLSALRAALPSKIASLLSGRTHARALHILQALSATPVAEVRQLYEEVGRRYGDSELARAARRALDNLARLGRVSQGARASTDAGFEGDLETFGIASLLQSLSEGSKSGRLSIVPRDARRETKMLLRNGEVTACVAGRLRGRDAVYQLMEEPGPAQYFFTGGIAPDDELPEEVPAKLTPLLMEGARRHDELQRLRAILPDDAALRRARETPIVPGWEDDGILLRDVWAAVKDQATPLECQERVASDAYRVRRLLGYWLERGVLQVAS